MKFVTDGVDVLDPVDQLERLLNALRDRRISVHARSVASLPRGVEVVHVFRSNIGTISARNWRSAREPHIVLVTPFKLPVDLFGFRDT
ncbi:MAG: hypothetical protein WA860_06805 [Acidimicrobiales bacterium]